MHSLPQITPSLNYHFLEDLASETTVIHVHAANLLTHLFLYLEGYNTGNRSKRLLLHEFTVIRHISDHYWTHEITLREDKTLMKAEDPC